jgi:predicted negative regulator of RcsB-dependent stress response
MNIIKEWWRDNADALITAVLRVFATLFIVCAIIAGSIVVTARAFPNDGKSEAVTCLCECNHP